MQKPSGEQIISIGPDIAAELKQVNTKKKNILENIQELDGQMKDLAKQVTQKVDTQQRWVNYHKDVSVPHLSLNNSLQLTLPFDHTLNTLVLALLTLLYTPQLYSKLLWDAD